MSTGYLHEGDSAARDVSARIGGTVADETALAAVPAKFRADGQVWFTADTGKSWIYKLASDATASDSVLAPASGSGRYHLSGGGSGGAAGATAVRLATNAALAAYTRTANVILANANGAMATVDGVAPVVGDLILLKDGAAGADNGIYVVDSIGGGAAKYQLTRAPGFDDSDGFTANPFLVAVSEGTVSADDVFILATNAPITLNTTSLAFTRLPSLVDLASVAAGAGAALIGAQDADGVFAGANLEAVTQEIGTAAVACATPVHNVRGASTADVPALAAFVVTHDGVVYVEGDRILLKDQTAPAENGIYVVGAVAGTAPLTRATDFDNAANVRTGCMVSVSEGTANADTIWRLTTNSPIVVGTTALAFAEVWTAARGLATAGAAAGSIADADGLITGATIEAGMAEIAGGGLVGRAPLRLARGASTANVANLAAFTVANDGIVFVEGELVLLKDQTAPEENGVYVVGVVGGGTAPLTRVTNYDGATEVKAGTVVLVSEGTANANTIWQLTTNDPIVVGTTGLVYAEIWSAARGLATAGAAAGAIADAGGVLAGGTIEAALQELALKHAGACMQSRLIMLGAPGAIVEGNTVVIGADTYEFRGSTPPAGGTPGRIWVYNGVDSAASRANFINAVNGVVDAPTITRDGTNTELVTAVAGVTLGDVRVYTSTAIGSAVPAASAAVIATTETLATATDIWDAANMYGGIARATEQWACATVTVNADMITAATLQVMFPFTPVHAFVGDRTQYHDETVTIVGDAVSVTLGGGAAPNIQAGDVIDVYAMG